MVAPLTLPAQQRTPSAARERILGTASELFYTEGVRAVGVDTIVARSEVAKATLYSHFASKDDLVLAVLERRDGEWLARLEAEVDRRDGDARERLLSVFDALADEFGRPDYRGSAFMNVATEIADLEHPARAACRSHKDKIRAYFTRLATDAGARDPEALSHELMLLHDGAICVRVVQGDRQAAARAKRAATVLLAERL